MKLSTAVFSGFVLIAGPCLLILGQPAAAGAREPAARAQKTSDEAASTESATQLVWMTNPTKMKIPDGPVSGKLLGEDFTASDVSLAGSLSLHGSGLSVTIALKSVHSVDQAAGRTIKVDTHKRDVATISVGSKYRFPSGYAMRLEFGPQKDGVVPGKIYLCLPDKTKSCIAGTFTLKPSEEALRRERLKVATSTTTKGKTDADPGNGGEPVWTTEMLKMKAPDAPVSGKIGGQDFNPEKIGLPKKVYNHLHHPQWYFPSNDKWVEYLPGGLVCFYEPKHSIAVWINLLGGSMVTVKQAANHKVKIDIHQRGSIPTIYVFREGHVDNYKNKYSMVLEFGRTKDGVVPGKIYLCLPDDSQSLIAGTFQLDPFEESPMPDGLKPSGGGGSGRGSSYRGRRTRR